jgi:hypothetical protein
MPQLLFWGLVGKGIGRSGIVNDWGSIIRGQLHPMKNFTPRPDFNNHTKHYRTL